MHPWGLKPKFPHSAIGYHPAMKPVAFPLAQGVSITLKVNALHSQINVSKTSRGIESLTRRTIGRLATRSKTKIAPAIIPTPNQVFTKKTVKENKNKNTSFMRASILCTKVVPGMYKLNTECIL